MKIKRIEIEGFLVFREKVEFDFSKRRIWLLDGPNGVGKSAIFDAITEVLYGQHRLGSKSSVQFINHDSDGAIIKLELELKNGQLFQATRTLKRKSSIVENATIDRVKTETLVTAFNTSSNSWEPVENTRKEVGFDAWVRDNIGLNYQAFVSCILLLQDQAGRLMSATPRESQDIMLSFIDFEPFRHIAKYHEEQARNANARVLDISKRLDGLAPVSDDMLNESIQECKNMEHSLINYQDTLKKVEIEYTGAQHILRIKNRRNELALIIEEAQGLLRNQDVVKKEYDRIREVQQVFPTLAALFQMGIDIEQLNTKQETVEHEAKQLEERSQILHEVVVTAQANLDSTLESLKDVEDTRLALSKSEENITNEKNKKLETVALRKEYIILEEKTNNLSDIELSIKEAEQAADKMQVITMAGKSLSTLFNLKKERKGHVDKLEQANIQKAQCTDLQAKTNIEILANQHVIDSVAETLKNLISSLNETDSKRRILENALLLREQAHNTTNCPTCTQLISRELNDTLHLEISNIRKEMRTLSDSYDKMQSEYSLLQNKEIDLNSKAKSMLAQLHTIEADLVRTDVGINDLLLTLQKNNGLISDTEQEVRNILGLEFNIELPDINALREDLKKVRDIANNKAVLEKEYQYKLGLKGRLGAIKQQLGSQIQDGQTIEDINSRLGDVQTLIGKNDVKRNSLYSTMKKYQADVQQLGRELSTVLSRHDSILREITTIRNNRDIINNRIEETKEALSQNWQEWFKKNTVHGLDNLRTDIAILPVIQAQFEGAQQASRNLASLLGEYKVHTEEIERLPKIDDGFDILQIENTIAEIRKNIDDSHKRMVELNDKRRELELTAIRTSELRLELAESDSEAASHTFLANRLGRQGLQARLIRDVQSGILKEANETLERLSDGKLRLSLKKGRTIDELQILIENMSYPGKFQPYEMFSGGQKFRIAIAVAMGIGQYLMKRSGKDTLDTIMIDEGFGSLDDVGVEDMANELLTLSKLISCVIVVSHQEKVKQYFKNRYEIYDSGGTSEAYPVIDDLRVTL